MRDHNLGNTWTPLNELMRKKRFQQNSFDEILVAIQVCVGTGYQNRVRFELFWRTWGLPSEMWVRLAPGNERNRRGQ